MASTSFPSSSDPDIRPAEVVRRRLRSVAIVYLAFGLVTALLPLCAALALIADLARGSRGAWMFSRLTAFLWVFLLSEVLGVAALGGSWVLARIGGGDVEGRLRDDAYAIQRAWTGGLFVALRRLFRLGLEVEGDDALQPAPFLLFMRHTSIIDTLLPGVLVANRLKIRLRYALKEELLVDPCLDIAGHRMPNCFLRRGSTDSAREIDRLRALTHQLGPEDGILIYPEGTRFTRGRQRQALERLQQSDPGRHDRVVQLRHLLPPRTSGPLALLESGLDVVVCAHVGLDGFAGVADIMRGSIVGQSIRVKLWRIEAERIPSGRAERIAWLDAIWADVDRWIDGVQPADAGREGIDAA